MKFLIVWSLVFSLTHGIEKEIVLHLWLKQMCPIEAERERLVNSSAVECSDFCLAAGSVCPGVCSAGER